MTNSETKAATVERCHTLRIRPSSQVRLGDSGAATLPLRLATAYARRQLTRELALWWSRKPKICCLSLAAR